MNSVNYPSSGFLTITQLWIAIELFVYCLSLFANPPDVGKFSLRPLRYGFLPWQLVTYAFLHASPAHLFFNLFGIGMFGAELERLWGGRRYIIYLSTCMLVAAATQLLVTSISGSTKSTVGASGALFGLLIGYGLMFPNRQIVPLILPVPMKAKYFVALYAAAEISLGIVMDSDGVAHTAHLGGMVAGYLVICFWRRKRIATARRRTLSS